MNRLGRRVLDLLDLVGRYGTQGFVVCIFVGLALPGAAAAARPLLSLCIFTFITLTFARADLMIIRRILRRPQRLAIACLWLTFGPAVLIGTALAVVGRPSLDPGMVLGLAIIGAAPPILSGPAVAAILGIEPSLLLSATVITTVLAPAISPFLADLVAGAAVPLDRLALALRLAVFIGGAIAVALIGRWAIGEEKLVARRRAIDGAGVVCYFIFAVAAMDGVSHAIMTRPLVVAAFLGAAFAVSFACLLSLLGGLALDGARRPADVRLCLGPAEHGSPHRDARRRRARDHLPVLRAGAVPDLPHAAAAAQHRPAAHAAGGAAGVWVKR